MSVRTNTKVLITVFPLIFKLELRLVHATTPHCIWVLDQRIRWLFEMIFRTKYGAPRNDMEDVPSKVACHSTFQYWPSRQILRFDSFEFSCEIEMEFLCIFFKITINGVHFCRFNHRFGMERVCFIAVDGDVTITSITSSDATSASAPPLPGPYPLPGPTHPIHRPITPYPPSKIEVSLFFSILINLFFGFQAWVIRIHQTIRIILTIPDIIRTIQAMLVDRDSFLVHRHRRRIR